ncbi:MAG TPA: hypothetical protein VK509_24095 [Polyangiales bacterium]|nr:hypothetical protein [Polyangiales bacterium]
MRWMRVTIAPQSLRRQPDGTFTQRLRFAAGNSMLLCTWRDGDLIAVPDAEMGAWGGPTDNLYDFDATEPYKVFQDTVPILAPEVLALIPLWSAHLRPYDSNPAIVPTAWPVLSVVNPE